MMMVSKPLYRQWTERRGPVRGECVALFRTGKPQGDVE